MATRKVRSWRSIILEASAERERALEIGRRDGLDRLPCWRALEVDTTWWRVRDASSFAVLAELAEQAASALRQRGIRVEPFAVDGISIVRSVLIFGSRDILGGLRPFDRRLNVSDHYILRDDRFLWAREKAARVARLLAVTAALPRNADEKEISDMAEALAGAWKEFSKAKRDVNLGEVRLSRIIEGTYDTALRFGAALHDVKLLSLWTRASALFQAACGVRRAIERSGMLTLPATRENARRCLDMRLWLETLEQRAETDLAELGLLERLGEGWHLGIPERETWNLLYWETPLMAPEHVRAKWHAKARRRAELSGRGRAQSSSSHVG